MCGAQKFHKFDREPGSTEWLKGLTRTEIQERSTQKAKEKFPISSSMCHDRPDVSFIYPRWYFSLLQRWQPGGFHYGYAVIASLIASNGQSTSGTSITSERRTQGVTRVCETGT